MKNVASDPAYAKMKTDMAEQLMSRLVAAKVPRVTGDGKTFERRPPFTDVQQDGGEEGGPKRGGQKKAE